MPGNAPPYPVADAAARAALDLDALGLDAGRLVHQTDDGSAWVVQGPDGARTLAAFGSTVKGDPGPPGAGGRLTLIEERVTGAGSTSQTFSAIPGTYDDLYLEAIVAPGDHATAQSLLMQFNGDTASNYEWAYAGQSGGTSAPAQTASDTSMRVGIVAVSGDTLTPTWVALTVPLYSGTSLYKIVTSRVSAYAGTTSFVRSVVATWRSTAAITSLTLSASAGTAPIGTGTVIRLYGVTA